jgi:hypothetical protein
MQGIEIPIGAPLGKLNQDLDGAQKALKGFTVAANGDLLSIGKSLGTLERQLKVFKDGIRNSTDPGRILLLNNAIKATETQLAGTRNAINNVGFNKFSTGSNQAAFALTNLGRVAQDAPFGFIGIQNNLNPLLESFQQLRAQNTSLGATFKALGQSLIGPAGLGIALSLVTAAFTFYTQYQQRANKGAKEAVDANKELADSIKTIEQVQAAGRANASEDLSRLQSLYNATQNVNIPIKERLKIAEELIKQNPQYLKGLNAEEIIAGKAATAYQTLTNAILAKGLAQAGEANRGKLTNKFLEDSTSLLIAQQELRAAESKVRAKPTATPGLAAAQQANQLSNSFNDARAKVDELNGALKNTENQLKLNDQVTQDLIKKFGGDIVIDPEKIDKSNKELKTQDDILKELSIDYKQIAADQQLIGSDVFTEKIKATKKALNDLIGIGVSTDSGIIKKLQSDLATLNQAAFTFNLKPQADKFSEQLRLSLIQFKVDAALVADEAKLKLDFIDPDQIDAAVKFAENAAKKIVDAFAPIKGPKRKGLIQFPSIQEESALVIQELLNFNTQASDIINNGLVETFSGIGNAIGDSLANGTDLAQNLGASLLSSLGSVLGQLGQMAIAAGLGIKAIKVALETLNPFVAIAAGVALIALSGVVRGQASKIGGGMGGGGGGGGGGNFSAPIPQASSTISTSAAGSAQDFGGGRVVFEISGTNLIGVLNRAGAKLQRFGP